MSVFSAAAPADGVYSGTTAQGRPISITVSGGAITGYTVSWSCGNTSGETTVGTTCSIAGDGSFSCGSFSCPGAQYVTNIGVSGTFSGSSVSGTLDINFNTGAGCCSLSGVSWSAQGSSSTPVIDIGDVTVPEGDSGTTIANFDVSLNQAADSTVTVDWDTVSWSATTADYADDSGTLTFQPGETSKTISVTVYGDTEDEGDEAFHVYLSNATNAAIGDNQGTCTITDDDGGGGGTTPELDIIVPAAARGAGSGGSLWLTRLYIRNTGSSSAAVTLYWLERSQNNANPDSQGLSIAAGETRVLDDVIFDSFGLSSAGGAIGITSDQPLVVTAAILNTAGGSEYGQGFDGIPVSTAITAGNSSSAVGLKHDNDFRTNVYLVDATGSGSTARINILNTSGNVVASKSYNLGPYTARLDSLDTFAKASFSNAAMEIEVTSGAVIGGASRVNQDSGDPITLKVPGLAPEGGGDCSLDGTYQFCLYDSDDWVDGGGYLVIENGKVTYVDVTYFNFDHGNSPYFRATSNISPGASYSSFAFLVELSSGNMDLQFELTHNGESGFTGTIGAFGSGFDDADRNGQYPPMAVRAGREK
jgi:hypothetical protein